MALDAFKTNPIALVKDLVVSLLQNSKIFVQKNEVDYISSVLNTSDVLESFIPAKPIEIGPIYSNEINKKLEGCYIDHYLQYKKLKVLYDGMNECTSIFVNKVSNITDQILEKESKLQAFKRSQSNNGLYNNIIHETFLQDNNYDGTDRKLSINRAANTLRLNNQSRNLITTETCNLKYEILTEGVALIDENPLDNLFTRNQFQPWYVSLAAKNFISNKQYSNLDLLDYTGAVILLRITFPSAQQINRFSYNSFSTDNLDLLGAFYSNYYDQDLNSRNIKSIDLSAYSNAEGLSKEINFYELINNDPQIVNANEMLIIFGQKNYLSINTNIKYDIPYTIDDVIVELKKEERATRVKNNSIKSIVPTTNIIDIDTVLNKSTSVDLKEGDKNFIIGLSLLSVENNVYDAFGAFRSTNYEINGNAFGFAIETNKKLYPIDQGVEMIYVNINSNKIPIASYDPEGRVKDTCILSTISLIDNTFLGYTNFIPELEDGIIKDGIFYLNGNLLSSDEYSILRKTPRGFELVINSELAQDGGQLIMAYTTAAMDHIGIEYHPERIDMEKEFGRPNIDINFLSKSISDYIYLKSGSSYISFLEGSEVSYTEILNNKYVSLLKTDSKGLELDTNDIKTDFTDVESFFDTTKYYYIPIEKAVGIEYERYQVIKNEKPKYDKGSGFTTNWTWTDIENSTSEYITLETQEEYLKNFIVVVIDNVEFRLNNIQQYTIDTDDLIVNKKRFRIEKSLLTNFKNLKVNYTPLAITSAAKTNILQHNDSEKFSQGTSNRSVTLLRFPYIDNEILTSAKWVVSRGVFYNIDNFSITYEPLQIKVGNKLALNATIYRDGQIDRFDTGDITYIVEDRKITFNQDITDPIEVKYYFLGNFFNIEIEMFKANSSKYFITPEIFDYTMFVVGKK